jgi:hypothetical protein
MAWSVEHRAFVVEEFIQKHLLSKQNKQHGSRIKTTQLIKKHMRSTWVPRVFTAIRK